MQKLIVLLIGGEVALQEGVVQRVVVECLMLMFPLFFLAELLFAFGSGFLLLTVINFHLL